jgi:hypothetical protein
LDIVHLFGAKTAVSAARIGLYTVILASPGENGSFGRKIIGQNPIDMPKFCVNAQFNWTKSN